MIVLSGSIEVVVGAEPGHTILDPLDIPLLTEELCISGIELRLEPFDRLGRWISDC